MLLDDACLREVGSASWSHSACWRSVAGWIRETEENGNARCARSQTGPAGSSGASSEQNPEENALFFLLLALLLEVSSSPDLPRSGTLATLANRERSVLLPLGLLQKMLLQMVVRCVLQRFSFDTGDRGWVGGAR